MTGLRNKAFTAALTLELAFLGEGLAKVAEFGLDHPLINSIIPSAIETGLITGVAAGLIQGGVGGLAIRPLRESEFWQRQIARQQRSAEKTAAASPTAQNTRHFMTSIFAGPLINLMRAHSIDSSRTFADDRHDVVRSSLEVTASATTVITALAAWGLSETRPETISNTINNGWITAGLIGGFAISNADYIYQTVKYHQDKHRLGGDAPLS
jgi:hypothetical protein